MNSTKVKGCEICFDEKIELRNIQGLDICHQHVSEEDWDEYAEEENACGEPHNNREGEEFCLPCQISKRNI